MINPNRLSFFFCLLSALVPLIAVDMPHGLAFAPGVIALVFFGFYKWGGQIPIRLSRPVLGLVVLTLAMAGLSLLWALHFDVSLKQFYKLALLLPVQILVISLALSLGKDYLQNTAPAFAYGLIFAALFLCFEIFSQGFVFNLIRGIDPGTPADPDEFNRGAVVVSLYAPAAFAILKTRMKSVSAFALIFAPIMVALFATQSQSAQLALMIGLVFLFAFPYRSKIAWRVLTFTLLAMMIAAPFVMPYIYQNYAMTIQNIPGMNHAYAGHRLEIWDFISRFALQEPLHGFGIEMTRATTFDSGHIFDPGNGILHPHNFVIQIWVEFGLPGILIAMGLVYALFSALEKNFTTAQQKILLPSVMAAMVPAAFAFGMWQGWWIGAQFHIAAIALIAARLYESEDK